MAVFAPAFDETQTATLAVLCETYVPSLEVESGDPLEREFMARSAGDLGVAAQIEAMLADTLLPEELAAVAGLLDALAAEGFAALPLEARTQVVHGFRDADPEAKRGLDQLRPPCASSTPFAISRATTRTGRRSASPARRARRPTRRALRRRSPSSRSRGRARR